MKKQTSQAFGKKIYLLAKEKDGTLLWLEEGNWDCDWYWGFGYVGSYTNNKNPDKAKDINSRSHYSGYCLKKGENGNYICILKDNPEIEETVLTDAEEWKLSDLMKSFYSLRDVAEIYHQGNSHYTSDVGVDLKNQEAYDRINKVEIPEIMKAVYSLLSE